MELEQIGIVKEVKGSRATVEVKRISGCGGGCKTCSGCDTPGHSLILKNDLNVEVGDMVKIKGQTNNFLKYTFIVYLIPLASLLIGLFGGIKLFQQIGIGYYEVAGFVSGLIFLAIGYLIVKLLDKSIAKRDEEFIKIIEIL